MKRKVSLWGFAAVLVGVVAYGVLVPRRKSAFEEGYGLRLVERSLSPDDGAGRQAIAIFASQDPIATTKARIVRGIGKNPSTELPGVSLWNTSEGTVQLFDRPGMVPEKGWPRDAASYVITLKRADISPIQRFAVLLGIKP